MLLELPVEPLHQLLIDQETLPARPHAAVQVLQQAGITVASIRSQPRRPLWPLLPARAPSRLMRRPLSAWAPQPQPCAEHPRARMNSSSHCGRGRACTGPDSR